jgi:hypothetical protein
MIEHETSLSPFLHTTTKKQPNIYYLPKTHNETSTKRLEQQQKKRKQRLTNEMVIKEISDEEKHAIDEEKQRDKNKEHKTNTSNNKKQNGDMDTDDHEHNDNNDDEHEHEHTSRRVVRDMDNDREQQHITVTMKGDTKSISLRGKRKVRDEED